MNNFLQTDIKYLKGVGENRAKELGSQLDIHTFADLLYYFPFRHIDKSRIYTIAEFSGEMPQLQVKGCFANFSVEESRGKKRLVGNFYDGRQFMQVIWFSRIQAFQNAYIPGKEYLLFGKPVYFHGTYSMSHPDVTEWNGDKPPSGFEGVYSLTDSMRKKGYTTRLFNTLVRNLFSMLAMVSISETLPNEILERYRLMPLREALFNMHFPRDAQSLQKAKERLKFEELYYLELHILRFSRERGRRIPGYVFPLIGDKFNGFYFNHIPFELTGAQKRVLKEIRADMRTGRQMNRLLQGDVGSGKTMVAFMTMLMAADNGCQSALMAPTEILATQHYQTIKDWGDALGLEVRLLTGSTKTKERREIHDGLISGRVNIIVGTHALIEDAVEFKRLGVAVIDEQHRFGVAQRAKMWKKNSVAPHVLVMTATPIPRTLAMTVYGDLDVSVIDELPPGRKPVETILRYDDNRMELNRLIMRELQAGRQAYIVYPLIKENEKVDLKSLEAGYERICEIFKGMEVTYVHGKMKPEEKDRRMSRFVSGEAKILVATTVIEVGVNVPNASVMLIENAERFGLSQLHQLRGRVGRGADKSYCILLSKKEMGGDTRKRLSIMTETTDGFLISEADMKLRGPGDMEGTQQSGLAFNLKVASLTHDGQILTLAREAALATLDANPEIDHVGDAENKSLVERHEGEFRLGGEGREILIRELRDRFAKTIDWSRIS